MTAIKRKNSRTIPVKLIAPCGMNCRLCWGYVREKNSCPGCLRIDTHESQKSWPKAFLSVNEVLKNHDCKILGEFDCCGENLVEKAQEQREAMYSRMNPEEREKAENIYLNFVKGHPDQEDLENATNFAKDILKNF